MTISYKNLATGDISNSIGIAVKWYSKGFRVAMIYDDEFRCDIKVIPEPMETFADLYGCLYEYDEGTVVYCEEDDDFHIITRCFSENERASLKFLNKLYA